MMTDYIFTGNALYYRNPKTHEYEPVCDITKEEPRNMKLKYSVTQEQYKDVLDALAYGHRSIDEIVTPFVPGNGEIKPIDKNELFKIMSGCQNKPEYSKMYKPKKKTKCGFDAMNNGDVIRFTVDKIYLNGSHTCVVWKDGTKTVVNCADGDYYDEYAAFTAALAKKIYGNNTALKRMLEEKTVVQKPLPGKDWREPEYFDFDPESMSSVIHDACKKLHDALRGIGSVEKKDND